MEKEILGRLVLKHDLEENWLKATTFIPKQGEIIIYDIDTNHNYERMKIGNGKDIVSNLPFVDEKTINLETQIDELSTDVAYINVEDNENIENPEIIVDEIIIDSTLSTTSTNPVQNKVTAQEINQLSEAINELKENGISGGGSAEDTVKDVSYYYDGNLESDKYEYIKTNTGATTFVKIAPLPDGGKVDLIGGNVSVKGEDGWLDFNFDISQDMLSQSVVKDGVTISAVIPNKITQIFYQGIIDTESCTYIIICEKAGRYDIAFENWLTNLYFPNTGIYVMDGRTYGKNFYVDYLNAKEVSKTNEEKKPTEYIGNEIQIFHKGICIGDSITEGYFDHNDASAIIKEYSYPTFLSRMTGIELINSGVSGFTSKQWYDASIDSDSVGGKWVNGEWVRNLYPEVGESDVVSSSLDYSDCDFAVIHLGINDADTIGESITLEQAIATFETSINSIISKLKASSNGIKIFLTTIIPYRSVNYIFEQFNAKISEIAEQTTDVYLLDLTTYSDCYGDIYGHGYHLTALGYHKMASEISAYISYIIHENLEDFKWVQFIGTSHTP